LCRPLTRNLYRIVNYGLTDWLAGWLLRDRSDRILLH
jgi:hypothetical protein